MIWRSILVLAILAESTNPQPVLPPPPLPPVAPALPLVHEVGPDEIAFKGILLEKKRHRISFPAMVNQRDGLIEYVLVQENGKTHESLFSTRVLPHDIHVAMLLIGLKEDDKGKSKETAPPSAIDSKYLQSAPKLKGPPVLLSVTWTQGGKSREVPVEDWIFNLQTHHPMTRGWWVYNGSFVENGVFQADEELSIVSVITDPTTLVNNPRSGYDNDQIWQVRTDSVPPMNTPVNINITLVESTPTTKP